MIKDTDEHPGEKIHVAKSRSIPYIGASVSVEWSVPPSQYMDVSTKPETLQTLYFGDFYEVVLWRILWRLCRQD